MTDPVISLPQFDPSPLRRSELVRIRAEYPWDHQTLAPYPALRVEAPPQTGVLHLASLVIGTAEGLPARERPSDRFLRAKLESSEGATREFLRRVPPADWAAAAEGVRTAVGRVFEQWQIDVAWPLFESWRATGAEHIVLPTLEDLQTTLTTHLLQAASEIAAGVDLDVTAADGLLQAAHRAIDGVLGRLGASTALRRRLARFDRTAHATGSLGPTAPAAGLRVHEAGIGENTALAVVVLQAALRFSARMRGPAFSVTDRRELTREMPDPQGPDPCTDDLTFGRWHTAGPNPVLLTRVLARERLPEGFGITDERLREGLRGLGLPAERWREADLDTAIAQGRLYLTDFEQLADLPGQTGPVRDFFGRPLEDLGHRQRHLPAPYGLFHQTEAGLWPVALQLGRDSKDFELFTPADEPELWSRVKRAYLCAYVNHHEMSTHLGGVHFLLMGFVVSAARQLHPDHPISVLLRHHFENLLWNDFLGLQVLVNPTGFVDQIMAGDLDRGSMEITRRFYRQWDYSQLSLPADLARRGVDDPRLLPDYPLRDDGLLLWSALRDFIAAYLGVYYPEPDRDMAGDYELQGWFSELRSPQGAHVAGLPESFDLEGLTDLLTGLVFRSSGFHSAVNYPQYEYFGDPSRAPAALYADVREIRERTSAEYLPGGDPALTQIAVVDVLSGMRDRVLTDYALAWFSDPRIWPLVADLRARFDQIEARIDDANRSRPRYDFLRPSWIAAAANV